MFAFAGTVADDIERIRQVRTVLDPGDVLVADANTGEQMRTADGSQHAVEYALALYVFKVLTTRFKQ